MKEIRKNPFKLDDILVCCWGYGQTNVDFYKVVKKSKRCIWLQKIEHYGTTEGGKKHKYTYKDGEGYCMPNINKHAKMTDNYGEEIGPLKKLVQFHNRDGLPYVKIESYSLAYLWDGKPVRESWYY
jgi:hypothetical protein